MERGRLAQLQAGLALADVVGKHLIIIIIIIITIIMIIIMMIVIYIYIYMYKIRKNGKY